MSYPLMLSAGNSTESRSVAFVTMLFSTFFFKGRAGDVVQRKRICQACTRPVLEYPEDKTFLKQVTDHLEQKQVWTL